MSTPFKVVMDYVLDVPCNLCTIRKIGVYSLNRISYVN